MFMLIIGFLIGSTLTAVMMLIEDRDVRDRKAKEVKAL